MTKKQKNADLLSYSLIHSYSTVQQLHCYSVSDLSPCDRNNSYLTREIVLFTRKERSDVTSDCIIKLQRVQTSDAAVARLLCLRNSVPLLDFRQKAPPLSTALAATRFKQAHQR